MAWRPIKVMPVRSKEKWLMKKADTHLTVKSFMNSKLKLTQHISAHNNHEHESHSWVYGTETLILRWLTFWKQQANENLRIFFKQLLSCCVCWKREERRSRQSSRIGSGKRIELQSWDTDSPLLLRSNMIFSFWVYKYFLRSLEWWWFLWATLF